MHSREPSFRSVAKGEKRGNASSGSRNYLTVSAGVNRNRTTRDVADMK
jgi:hypothetical protein